MPKVITRKRGNSWEYRIELAKIGGKRKQKSKGGFKTQKEANAAGILAMSEYQTCGIYFTPSEISFSDYLKLWMNQYCETNLNQSTCENYKKKIRLHIEPRLGIYKLKALTSVILQDFINLKFNEGYSRNTLSVIKGMHLNSKSSSSVFEWILDLTSSKI